MPQYTVQAQTCNDTGTCWTGVDDPENVTDPGSPDVVALDLLSQEPRIFHTGSDWRVCIWAGHNASPVTDPLYILDSETWRDASLDALERWEDARQPEPYDRPAWSGF